MKKQLAIAISAIAAFAVIVAGVAFLVFNISKDNEPTVGPGGGITYFKYEFGSYFGGEYTFFIKKDNSKITYKAIGGNGADLNVSREINDQELSGLAQIVDDYGVDKWNGFNQSDNDIMDGYSFELEITYANGKEIKAEGYNKYPDGYDAAHEKLKEYLLSIK